MEVPLIEMHAAKKWKNMIIINDNIDFHVGECDGGKSLECHQLLIAPIVRVLQPSLSSPVACQDDRTVLVPKIISQYTVLV